VFCGIINNTRRDQSQKKNGIDRGGDGTARVLLDQSQKKNGIDRRSVGAVGVLSLQKENGVDTGSPPAGVGGIESAVFIKR
jgi:hypothetical protein